jgi:hypothetical protein
MGKTKAKSKVKKSSRPAKARSPQPGDWVAHKLHNVDHMLCFGRDMLSLLAQLREQNIGPNQVGVYQVPLPETDFLGGGALTVFPRRS